MHVVVKPNVELASQWVAQLFKSQLEMKPTCVLGLATGRTPVQMYAELIRLHREESLDFSQATTFNLDEYLGIGPDHPGSFHRFMHENLFSSINIEASRINIPDGLSTDPEKTCLEYEESITRAGGIDLQLLGLGRDGHIGFNEPGSSLQSRTRVETLLAVTRNDNRAAFSEMDWVPRQAITMGIATILEARRIVMLVLGRQKAEVARAGIEGPVTAELPASALQLHRDAIIVLDEPAGSLLQGHR